jgi:acyl-CoA thioesterase
MESTTGLVTDNDEFARHSGIEVVQFATGYAKVKMAVEQYHLNGVGIVNGGAIFTLADFAFGVASNAQGQGIAVGINASIAFIKAVKSGILFAEAQEVSRSSKLGNYNVRVTNENNDLVAVLQGMVYRKVNLVD